MFAKAVSNADNPRYDKQKWPLNEILLLQNRRLVLRSSAPELQSQPSGIFWRGRRWPA